jgi:hypothetical protein
VVNELGRDGAFSVTMLQTAFNDLNELKMIKTDLAYIHANFTFLSQSVTKVEETTFGTRNEQYTGQSQRL